MTIPYYSTMMAKITEYCQTHLTTTPRVKDRTVTADSLAPVFKLLKKKVAKWDDADGDLLLKYIGNVARVDARNSTPEAIQNYCALAGKVSQFYIYRPDIKVKIDPELVIFDLSGVDVDIETYSAELAVYELPAHFGDMPMAVNPGPIGTVFPMPTIEAADHLITWMMNHVPGLHATLQPGAPAGALVY
jgi:hypothetical protein